MPYDNSIERAILAAQDTVAYTGLAHETRGSKPMPTEAHTLLLEREKDAGAAAEHYAAQLNMLEDLVNYGTWLVLRVYNSTPRDLTGLVVCGVLLKQIVTMVDAAHTLAGSGASYAAYGVARSALEASLYLDWMLLRDSEEKARCYVVGNYRADRTWAKRAIRGTREHSEWARMSQVLGVNMTWLTNSVEADAHERLAEVESVLGQSALADVDTRYDALKAKRRREPKWYALMGVSGGLREIARDVGRLPEYVLHYQRASAVVHSGSYRLHVQFSGGALVHLRRVRDFQEMFDVVNCCVAAALTAYRRVLHVYRPSELDALSRTYVNEWREPFLTTRRATANPTPASPG